MYHTAHIAQSGDGVFDSAEHALLMADYCTRAVLHFTTPNTFSIRQLEQILRIDPIAVALP